MFGLELVANEFGFSTKPLEVQYGQMNARENTCLLGTASGHVCEHQYVYMCVAFFRVPLCWGSVKRSHPCLIDTNPCLHEWMVRWTLGNPEATATVGI